jgi:hypothetical protein
MNGLRNLPYGIYGYEAKLYELGDELRYAKQRLRDMEAQRYILQNDKRWSEIGMVRLQVEIALLKRQYERMEAEL